MATHQFSRAAYDRLKAEFDDLTTRGRIDVAEKIERAREEGDLKENAGYHAAKDEQGHMEGRIRQLEHLLDNAEIIADQSVYTILYEGDSPDHGRALRRRQPRRTDRGCRRDQRLEPARIGAAACRQGDTVSYEAPNGSLTVTVLKVESL